MKKTNVRVDPAVDQMLDDIENRAVVVTSVFDDIHPQVFSNALEEHSRRPWVHQIWVLNKTEKGSKFEAALNFASIFFSKTVIFKSDENEADLLDKVDYSRYFALVCPMHVFPESEADMEKLINHPVPYVGSNLRLTDGTNYLSGSSRIPVPYRLHGAIEVIRSPSSREKFGDPTAHTFAFVNGPFSVPLSSSGRFDENKAQ